MPRGGRRHRNRPKVPQSMNEFHTQLTTRFIEMTLYNGVSLYSGMITKNSGEGGCTLLFIIPEVKEIFGTGSTFSFICDGFLGPSFGNVSQKLYVILGMHNNIAFVIGFALMSESTKSAFRALYYKILSIEPRWRPKTLISSYNTEEIEAIKSVFPNITIQGCWFYSCRSVWKQLDSLALGIVCNTNRIAYEHMHMWTALPLLPTEETINGFIDLKAHLIRNLQSLICSAYCRKFNSFFNVYKALWFEGVKGEIFPMKNAEVLRSNIEIELCCQHLQANMKYNTNPAPWQFISSLIAYSKFAIVNYQELNEGYYDAFEHTRRTWIGHVETYERSLENFYERRGTLLQFLLDVMCITPGFEPPLSNTTGSIPWNLLTITERNDDDDNDDDDDDDNDDDDDDDDDYYDDVYDDDYDEEILMFNEDDSSDDESFEEGSPGPHPRLVSYLRKEIDFEPLVEETCCLCLTAHPEIIISPCMHQCMCKTCYEQSKKIEPYRRKPYYRCSLCRGQIDFYISLN